MASLNTPGAVDNDLREALESMIKTYRTRASGLIFETRPGNAAAAMLQQKIFASLEEYQKAGPQSGARSLRDADVLGALVLLQRVAMHWNNQRPLGRTLISFLLETHGNASPQPTPAASSLLIG